MASIQGSINQLLGRAAAGAGARKHLKGQKDIAKSQEDVAEALNKAKEEGKKIISVGTTTTRTLESVYKKYGKFVACSEDTNIFIFPGYKFEAIDGLITNFHLPKSTLLMLVSAFSTKELMLKAYNEAVREEYRFFSFGDCMYIK